MVVLFYSNTIHYYTGKRQIKLWEVRLAAGGNRQN